MSTTIPDPPQAGGVKAVPEAGKTNPLRNACIVAKRAIGKASGGRHASIETNPDPAKSVGKTAKARTM